MVGAAYSERRKMCAGKRAETALHAVAHDRVADLLGDRVADANRRIAIAARTDLKDETGHGKALSAVGGEEIRALGKRN
ncbi:MAG: hypothetical protein NVS3B5_12900 [Sphingomicrobium sp.]